MGIETQTMKPQAVDKKVQVHDTRKRTISSAAGCAGDANLSTTCPAAAVPAAGATDDEAFLPRKIQKLVAISNDGWGDFFKSRDNFVTMHIC